MKTKYRIVECCGENFSKHYIVQKKTFLLGWRNLWPDYEVSDVYFMTWDRMFETQIAAENALNVYLFERTPDLTVKTIEV